MLAEIEKNQTIASKYSKYEMVRVVFELLKEKKEELDKAHKKMEITEIVEQIIADLAEGKISNERIDELLERNK